MTSQGDRNPLRRRRTRDRVSAGKALARAHPAAPDRGVADEERFAPVVGHDFNLSGEWGGVLECEVLVVEPHKALSYTWDYSTRGCGLRPQERGDLRTLTPTSAGTHLRMEQSGFRPDQQQAYRGANAGWQSFLARLEQLWRSPLEFQRHDLDERPPNHD